MRQPQVPYVTWIHPLHHVTCDVRLEYPPGATARVVVTRDGIFGPLLDWFLAPRNVGKSRSWQIVGARAAGLFYDFVQQLRQTCARRDRGETILSDFALALLRGTVGVDGEDPTGLHWPKTNFWSARNYIGHLTQFTDFCAERYGSSLLNPWTAANWGERIAIFRAWDLRNRRSLLKHAADRQAAWRSSAKKRAVTLCHAPQIELARPPFFPPEKFPELIQTGFLMRGGERHPQVHTRYHLPDMMIGILQGAGGLRECEPFHLFVDDVREHPTIPGMALVRVHHPEEGKYRYPDPITRSWVSVSRADYLKRLGLLPRNRSPERRLAAGWKNPLLVRERTGDLYMQVHWFPTWWGELFWKLYRLYISNVRPSSRSPFLFISRSPSARGDPYTIQQYNKKLRIAVRRIGLVPEKSAGTTSHGLRHMYGQRLKQHGLDIAEIQKCMHHKSSESTAVYTRADAEEINVILRKKTEGIRPLHLPELFAEG